MSSHLWGVRLAVLIAAAASLGACRTFSPDGGMEMVAAVAGTGLNKDVVQIRSAEDAAAVRARVTKLLHRPLGADAAVQIALLNNLGLQAAYNRLGIAEALAVKASRPPSLSFAFSDVSTPVELDIERQIIGSLLYARDHAGAHQDRLRSIRGRRASRRGGDLARGGRDAARLSARGRGAARSWRRSARLRRTPKPRRSWPGSSSRPVR